MDDTETNLCVEFMDVTYAWCIWPDPYGSTPYVKAYICVLSTVALHFRRPVALFSGVSNMLKSPTPPFNFLVLIKIYELDL